MFKTSGTFINYITIIFLLSFLAGCSSLNRAASTNDIQLLEKTISEGKESLKTNPTPMIIAAQKGHNEITKALLNAGANPNLTDFRNQTPLLWAASKNHPQIIQILLEAKADTEIKESKFGQTALMVASIKNHDESLNILLKGGASPDVFANNGVTPLIEAVVTQNFQTVSVLLENGADANLTNKHSVSPLIFAASKSNSEILKNLIAHNADINHASKQGETALFSAVANNQIANINFLLKKGANPNIHTAGGNFPLMAAAALNNPTSLKSLIENGADVNFQNNFGNTPLIYASGNGFIDIVKILLNNGADPTIVQSNGVDALTAANSRNFLTISTLIRSAMLSPAKTPSVTKPSPLEYSIYTGTGWVTKGGYIVTNHHVVDGHIETKVRFNSKGSKTYNAKVVLSDRHNDLAILQLEEPTKFTVKGIAISSQLPNTGEDVFTIGYPKTSVMGKNAKVTNGIISSLSGIHDDPRIIQTTVAIQSGNSGGPLLNMDGEAVGVTTSTLRALVSKSGLDIPQNVNYAVKSVYVLALLSSLPEKNYPILKMTSSNLENIIPKIQDSIVQIIVKSTK